MAKSRKTETPENKPETPENKPETPEKIPAITMTALERAKLAQFKRLFPRECALLIAEHEATKAAQ